MSEKEDTKTEEAQMSGNANAAASGSGAASLGASTSSKKTEEKRKPKKLGQKGQAGDTPTKEVNGEVEGEEDANEELSAPQTPEPKVEKARSQSRRQSRGRGRSQQPSSDAENMGHSDVSQKGGRRSRNRNRGKGQPQMEMQQQQDQPQQNGLAGPLDAVDEVGETVSGVTDAAQDLVSNTAGKVLDKPHEALGGLLSNKKKKNKGEVAKGDDDDEGENEQLRLRLDLNLDIEVQLKAKIHGDLTLGLLYVLFVQPQSGVRVIDFVAGTNISTVADRYRLLEQSVSGFVDGYLQQSRECGTRRPAYWCVAMCLLFTTGEGRSHVSSPFCKASVPGRGTSKVYLRFGDCTLAFFS